MKHKNWQIRILSSHKNSHSRHLRHSPFQLVRSSKRSISNSDSLVSSFLSSKRVEKKEQRRAYFSEQWLESWASNLIRISSFLERIDEPSVQSPLVFPLSFALDPPRGSNDEKLKRNHLEARSKDGFRSTTSRNLAFTGFFDRSFILPSTFWSLYIHSDCYRLS